MTDIDVVIVNYRSASHTVNCVRTAHQVAGLDGVNVKIIVVNNGDNDEAFDQTISAAGDVTIIDNALNAGFGTACNQGAMLGDAAVILFLNPDAILAPGSLRACYTVLSDPAATDIGIIGPEIVDREGKTVPSCSRTPTLADLLIRSIGAHTLFRSTGYPFLSLADHAKSRDVGQVMGAALFIHRSLFTVLRGFDERFFLYYEDVDLCARAQALASRCYYLKTAQVMHIGRASSSQDTGLSLALHIRSRLKYTGIHFGRGAQLLLAVTSLLVELPMRLVQAAFGGGAVGLRGVCRTYQILLTNAVPQANMRPQSNASNRGAV